MQLYLLQVNGISSDNHTINRLLNDTPWCFSVCGLIGQATWKQKAMLCCNWNKSLEKERKDAAHTGASQFEPALVRTDRERRGGTRREEEHWERELCSANSSFQRLIVRLFRDSHLNAWLWAWWPHKLLTLLWNTEIAVCTIAELSTFFSPGICLFFPPFQRRMWILVK